MLQIGSVCVCARELGGTGASLLSSAFSRGERESRTRLPNQLLPPCLLHFPSRGNETAKKEAEKSQI